MGRKSGRKEAELSEDKSPATTLQKVPAAATIDPTLDALFKSSLTESTVNLKRQKTVPVHSVVEEREDGTSSSGESSPGSSDSTADAPNSDTIHKDGTRARNSRKRKRKDEDVEERYLKRLVEEEQRDQVNRKKASLPENDLNGSEPSDIAEDTDEGVEVALSGSDEELPEIPQHEVFSTGTKDAALDKAKRTVFLSNVSTAAISSKASRRTLLDHLASFLTQLPDQETSHKVESIRFRSTAFALVGIPKRAAFAKKELMETTTKGTNAYVVYSTDLAAREAVKKLNGSVVLDRHIRVDSVAHPSPIDHHRCVFVGNLGFVDDESMMKSAEDADDNGRPKKTRPPGDVEEGLWRQFLKAGQIESVRVVRDSKTRVGKGFAYVQFTDGNAVERALAYHDKRFPPLLPRPLRVVRAKHPSKTASNAGKKTQVKKQQPQGIYNPKQSAEAQSLAGRASKLFGKGGAARLSDEGKGWQGTVAKGPESFVFEGHRARPGQGSSVLKASRKGKGKPTTRSSRRGAAFKAAGGNKKKTN